MCNNCYEFMIRVTPRSTSFTGKHLTNQWQQDCYSVFLFSIRPEMENTIDLPTSFDNVNPRFLNIMAKDFFPFKKEYSTVFFSLSYHIYHFFMDNQIPKPSTIGNLCIENRTSRESY